MSTCFTLTNDRSVRELRHTEQVRREHATLLAQLRGVAEGAAPSAGITATATATDSPVLPAPTAPPSHLDVMRGVCSGSSSRGLFRDPGDSAGCRAKQRQERRQPPRRSVRSSPSLRAAERVIFDDLPPAACDTRTGACEPPLDPTLRAVPNGVHAGGAVGPRQWEGLMGGRGAVDIDMAPFVLLHDGEPQRRSPPLLPLRADAVFPDASAAPSPAQQGGDSFAGFGGPRASRLGNHPLPHGTPAPTVRPRKERSATMPSVVQETRNEQQGQKQHQERRRQRQKERIADALRAGRQHGGRASIPGSGAAAGVDAAAQECLHFTPAVAPTEVAAAGTAGGGAVQRGVSAAEDDVVRRARRRRSRADEALPLRVDEARSVDVRADSAVPAAVPPAVVTHQEEREEEGRHPQNARNGSAKSSRFREARPEPPTGVAAPSDLSSPSGMAVESPPPTPFRPCSPRRAAKADSRAGRGTPQPAVDADLLEYVQQQQQQQQEEQKVRSGVLRTEEEVGLRHSHSGSATGGTARGRVSAMGTAAAGSLRRGISSRLGSSTRSRPQSSAAVRRREDAALERRRGPQVQPEKVAKYPWNPEKLLPKTPFRRPCFSTAFVSSILERDQQQQVPAALPNGRLPTARVAIVVGPSEFDDTAFASLPLVYEDAMGVAAAFEAAGYLVERLIGRGGEVLDPAAGCSRRGKGVLAGRRGVESHAVGSLRGAALASPCSGDDGDGGGGEETAEGERGSAHWPTSPIDRAESQQQSFLHTPATSPPLSVPSPAASAIDAAKSPPPLPPRGGRERGNGAGALVVTAVTQRPTFGNIASAVAKYAKRSHLFASIVFLFVGCGGVQECMIAADNPVKLLCCADSRHGVPSTCFPVDVVIAVEAIAHTRIPASSPTTSLLPGRSQPSPQRAGNTLSHRQATPGSASAHVEDPPHSTLGLIVDLRAVDSSQHHGVASVHFDGVGGQLSAEYGPTPSHPELIGAAGGLLISTVARALTGKAARDTRLTPNSLNVFLASRLLHHGVRCNTTATPLQFGDTDLVHGRTLMDLRMSLRAARLAKSRAFTSVKVGCFVSEVGARNLQTVTSQLLRKLRNTPKWHMQDEFVSLTSAYLLGTLYVAFKTRDAYNMAVIELDGHCKRHIQLPSPFTTASVGPGRGAATRAEGGLSRLGLGAAGDSAGLSLAVSTCREAAQLRLRIDLPSEPSWVREGAVAVVREFVHQRSLAAKIFVLAELNLMTTERGRRKLDGLLRDHCFTPSLILHSMCLDKEQLARIHAAVAIQARWRCFITRKRFVIGRALLHARQEAERATMKDWAAGWVQDAAWLHESERATAVAEEAAVRLRLEEAEYSFKQELLRLRLRNFSRAVASGRGPLSFTRPLTFEERLVPPGRAELRELATYTMLLSDDEREVLFECVPDAQDAVDGCLPPGTEAAAAPRRHLSLDALRADDPFRPAVVLTMSSMMASGSSAADATGLTFTVTRRFLRAKRDAGSVAASALNAHGIGADELPAFVVVRSRGEISRDEERHRFLLEWRRSLEELLARECAEAPGVFGLSGCVVAEARGRFGVEDEQYTALLRLIAEMRRFLVLPSRLMPPPPTDPFKWTPPTHTKN